MNFFERLLHKEVNSAIRWLSRSEAKRKITESECVDLQRKLDRHCRTLRRLEKKYRGRSKKAFEVERDKYLNSFDARVFGTVRAFGKTRREATLKDILTFAEKVDVHRAESEGIRVSLSGKSKGGYRMITKHGPRRMTQQFVVRDFLSAIGIDSEFDYSRPGAGGEKALLSDISTNICEGDLFWKGSDIRNFFASLRPGHLSWLPLPIHVIRNVVFLPKSVRIRMDIDEDILSLSDNPIPLENAHAILSKEVRRGLPQGAVLSPLVARAFQGRMLREALDGMSVVVKSYSDDIYVGARNKADMVEGMEVITNHLHKLSAGPILAEINGYKPEAGDALVLGYLVNKNQGNEQNPVHVKPSAKRFWRLYRRIWKKWEESDQSCDLESFVRDQLDKRLPSQSAWTRIEFHSYENALNKAFMFVMCMSELSNPTIEDEMRMMDEFVGSPSWRKH